ncbi:hypothetical protein GCM10010214_20620 [Streptomyces abikoensis]|nr:hypothetical protein GCM10010214_20620 [Streptomyces abikoensis]
MHSTTSGGAISAGTPEQVVTPPIEGLIGRVVVDTTCKRVGRVMGNEGPKYQLRPLRGGREWEVSLRNIEVLPTRADCPQCVGIKTARSRANDEGRTNDVSFLTAALGRHQRSAHS